MQSNIYFLNNRYYRIVNTGKPYKLGYPEINEGAEHFTMSTGYRIESFLTESWGNIVSAETFEAAAETILMFDRQRVTKGSTAEKCLDKYAIKSVQL